MIGFLATVSVVLQMAFMAFGINTHVVMAVGLLGCVAWIIHSIRNNDMWLLVTNIVIGGFAIYGLS